jgi:hypothetical protein
MKDLLRFKNIQRGEINQALISSYLASVNSLLESNNGISYDFSDLNSICISLFVGISADNINDSLYSAYENLSFLDKLSVVSNLILIRRDISMNLYNNFSFFNKNKNKIVERVDKFIIHNLYDGTLYRDTLKNLSNKIVFKKGAAIALFADDITNERSNTLSSLLFDIIKLLSEDFVKFYIVPYRAHGFKNIVRFPQNHYWDFRTSSCFSKNMNLTEDLTNKIEVVQLEDLLDGRVIEISCGFFFPFRLAFLDRIISGLIPSIAYEMMASGEIIKNGATIVIPNGIPTKLRPIKDSISTIYAVPPVFLSESYQNEIRLNPLNNRSVISIAANMERRCGDGFNSFIRFIASFLAKYNDSKFTLIGCEDIRGRYGDLDQYIDEGRLIVKKFSLNLNEECKPCSIYIHPPISGGGRSTYIAALNNIWTLSLDTTDASKWVHPDFIYYDEQNYYASILNASENLKLIENNSKKSYYYASALLKNSISHIDYMYAINKSIELFNIKIGELN